MLKIPICLAGHLTQPQKKTHTQQKQDQAWKGRAWLTPAKNPRAKSETSEHLPRHLSDISKTISGNNLDIDGIFQWAAAKDLNTSLHKISGKENEKSEPWHERQRSKETGRQRERARERQGDAEKARERERERAIER